MQDFRGRMVDDFAPATLEAFVARELGAVNRTSWSVSRDGELCGVVSFDLESPVMGVASAIFRRDFWGHETTLPALRLVYAEIFASGVRKICGRAFRDNNAVLSVAAALGAKREGVLREHALRGGKMVDMVVTGLNQGDFERCRS